jgi:hypothetical protein
MNHHSPRAGIAVLALMLSACASGPQIRTDADRSVDFSGYRSYDFAAELGTDRAGYSTLETNYFKQAVGRELEARGYHRDEAAPDLLVNFNTRVRIQSDVVSVPQPTFGAGYYGYRYGLYTAWPMYSHDVNTVSYKIGTANVDIVDARRRQLVWEGIAEGELTGKALDDPGTAIAGAIAKMFEKYPARAGEPARFDSR